MRVILLAGLLAIAGCSQREIHGTIPPGSGVSEAEALEHCETLDRWNAELAMYTERSEREERTVVPNRGDDLCKVLAKVGAPSNVERYLDEDGRELVTYRYWSEGFDSPIKHHFVTLRTRDDGTGIVEAVTW